MIATVPVLLVKKRGINASSSHEGGAGTFSTANKLLEHDEVAQDMLRKAHQKDPRKAPPAFPPIPPQTDTSTNILIASHPPMQLK